jgi:hypothetical protein
MHTKKQDNAYVIKIWGIIHDLNDVTKKDL